MAVAVGRLLWWIAVVSPLTQVDAVQEARVRDHPKFRPATPGFEVQGEFLVEFVNHHRAVKYRDFVTQANALCTVLEQCGAVCTEYTRFTMMGFGVSQATDDCIYSLLEQEPNFRVHEVR